MIGKPGTIKYEIIGRKDGVVRVCTAAWINNHKVLYGSRPEHRTAETLKEISRTLAMLYDKLDDIFPDSREAGGKNENRNEQG